MIKAGSNHKGSFPAKKIEKDDNNATFEQIETIELNTFLGSLQMRYVNAFNHFLLSLDTWPRTDISIENRYVLYRRDKSATK